MGVMSSPAPLLDLTGGGAAAKVRVRGGETLQCTFEDKLKYLFRAPVGYDQNASMSSPLVVFLHGASARGDSFEMHSSMALPKEIDDIEAIVPERFLLLSPLCPKGKEWKSLLISDAVLELIRVVSCQFNVDPKRVYLTGISMGGLGTWMIGARAAAATKEPKFAAIAPMCSGGNAVFARILKDTPCWFFHSQEDNVIGVEETDVLYKVC